MITGLPNDLIVYFFAFPDNPRDAVRLSMTCKRFYALLDWHVRKLMIVRTPYHEAKAHVRAFHKLLLALFPSKGIHRANPRLTVCPDCHTVFHRKHKCDPALRRRRGFCSFCKVVSTWELHYCNHKPAICVTCDQTRPRGLVNPPNATCEICGIRSTVRGCDKCGYVCEKHVCSWCLRPARHACGKCMGVKYCGKWCQAKHWMDGGHRNECEIK